MKNKLQLLSKKVNVMSLIPILLLVVVVLFFAIATQGVILNRTNLVVLVNQSVATLIIALGMCLVISVGGTDISCGAVMALGGILGCMAAQRWGAIFMFIVTIGLGAAVGAFIGFVNTRFKVPSFMVSLATATALQGVVSYITGTEGIYANDVVLMLDEWIVKIPVLVVLIIIFGYVSKYTPFGKNIKAIGENEVAARYAGVRVERVKMICFIICGIMAAIAGIFTVARSGGAYNGLGQGMEMRAMMCIFVAGVPSTGGYESKIYKLIFGAPIMSILENGLILLGCSSAVAQLVKGIILLAAVVLSERVRTMLGIQKAPGAQSGLKKTSA